MEPFCDNPKCQFHGVQVNETCAFVHRKLANPYGEDPIVEQHLRYTYVIEGTRKAVFCDICNEAIQTIHAIPVQVNKELWTPREKQLVILQ